MCKTVIVVLDLIHHNKNNTLFINWDTSKLQFWAGSIYCSNIKHKNPISKDYCITKWLHFIPSIVCIIQKKKFISGRKSTSAIWRIFFSHVFFACVLLSIFVHNWIFKLNTWRVVTGNDSASFTLWQNRYGVSSPGMQN